MHIQHNIPALINLLDDPDHKIYTQISNELLNLGEEAIPFLESAWENSFNAILQQRIEEVLHQIQFQGIVKGLQAWVRSDERSLFEASILVAKYQYSDIDVSYIQEFVNEINSTVWLELNDNLTALEKAQVINKVFFEIFGFSGNKRNFYSPQNLFINNVIEGRKGSPITLSILMIEVARRNKIPIYGINLPEHFILAYTHLPKQFYDEIKQEDVLFYINPFNKGTIFEKKDIDTFLSQLKIEARSEFFLPADNITIVKRLLQNLKNAYKKSGYSDKEDELNILLAQLEDK